MNLKFNALQVIRNFGAGMSVLDDRQLDAVSKLANQAAEIVALVEERIHLVDLLATATTAVFDLHKGYSENELAASQGSGFDSLAVELVTALRVRGIDDEGAWTVPATNEIPVARIPVSRRGLNDSSAPDTHLIALNGEQMTLLRNGLQAWVELLSSPTSADRDQLGGEWADAKIKACKELLTTQLVPT